MEKIIKEKAKFYIDSVKNINPNAKIIAVTKTILPEIVNIATSQGIDVLGENRVQELLAKYDDYDCKNIHFIGHLQSNKVKQIVDKVNMIQSVDSVNLAKVINEQSLKYNKIMDILIQINISNEDSKNGILSNEVEQFMHDIKTFKNINVRGFMTIPKKSDDAQLERDFDAMNEIFNSYSDLDILSMGMTNDYALALKHGATMVRIGRGLFNRE